MSDLREAYIHLLNVEKIKSELLIASKLVYTIESLDPGLRIGAEKLFTAFLNALLDELRTAVNATGGEGFGRALRKVEEAVNGLGEHDYEVVLKKVSEAISHATAGGQKASQTLFGDPVE